MKAESAPATDNPGFALPEPFLGWFASRGWQPRAHQLELLSETAAGRSMLLIAPTGAGKTLAGFLPSLTELAARGNPGLAPPVRGRCIRCISRRSAALAVDIERNLARPVEEMGLPVRIETRTGDTPQSKRARQRTDPPDILLTTPEQVSLLIANTHAERLFAGLRYVIFDELHSLIASKRGHLLSLALARLRKLAPGLQTIGLSATVADPEELQRWLVPQSRLTDERAGRITVAGGASPIITILESEERIPWSGHSARYAIPDVYQTIKDHRTTLIFVNTRSQAELLFQELWRINDDSLPIALHHGSLDAAAAAAGGGGDGAQRAPRRGRHLDTGPGDRLGRRRSGRPCRRAKGCKPAGAAHRAGQPPHGRAEPGHPDTGEPLRGAGMPGRDRLPVMSARRIRHQAATAGSTCWPSTCSAWRRRLPSMRRISMRK